VEIGIVSGVYDVEPYDLTWMGHEFLSSIRSPEIWKKTKSGVKKIGGASVDLMWEVAKAYAKHVAKEKLGIDF